MASLFRKQPRPPRKWYQKNRYQLPMLLAGLLVFPVWMMASFASDNLAKAPPAGTVYHIPHYHHFGYKFVTSPNGRNVWTRFCVMAKGGTVTLTKLLLIRRDVSLINVIADLNESAVFTY